METESLREQVKNEIGRIAAEVRSRQDSDGSWRYSAESGPMTDAYFIIALRALERNEPELIAALAKRLLHLQRPDGAWQLHDGADEGDLSTTVECCFACLSPAKWRRTIPA